MLYKVAEEKICCHGNYNLIVVQMEGKKHKMRIKSQKYNKRRERRGRIEKENRANIWPNKEFDSDIIT